MSVPHAFSAIAAVTLLLASVAHASDDLSLRLWLEWGSQPRRSDLQLRLSAGTITEVERLSVHGDDVAACSVSDRRLLRVSQAAPRAFDCVSLLVTGPRSATLTIQISPDDAPSGLPVIVPLEQLVSESLRKDFDSGIHMTVRRDPGDRLRIAMERDNLVFEPGEKFTFSVRANELDWGKGTPTRCRVSLLKSGADGELWGADRDFTLPTDAAKARQATPLANVYVPTGETATPSIVESRIGPFDVQMPKAAGVYELRIRLTPTHTTPFTRSARQAERHLQLVVVDPPGDKSWLQRMNESRPTAWATLVEFTAESWFAQRLPGRATKLFRDVAERRPTGNDRARLETRGDQRFALLEPGGWLACPLEAGKLGMPHALEVVFPRDHRQSLGISLWEADDDGDWLPLGRDTGLETTGDATLHGDDSAHRLLFWPRAKNLLLIVTNLHPDMIAFVGGVRLQVGPERLAPRNDSAAPGRLVAPYLERPLLVEAFGGPAAKDPETGQWLRDWSTFLQAGQHFVEYLRYAGYNGAMLSVADDGGTLYPSRLLEPTLQWDNGSFSSLGRDPVRKDVVEMLLRQFDREGLQLIPALHLNAPLPDVERYLSAAAPESSDSSLPVRSPRRYDPLDLRVQSAIRGVVREFVSRYGHHASFGGVALQLDAETCLALRDEPLNDSTQTRMRKIAELHQTFAADVTQVKPAARFYLVAPRLLEDPVYRRLLNPGRPLQPLRLRDSLTARGLDPLTLGGPGSGLRPLRPYFFEPESPWRANLETAWDALLNQAFAQPDVPAGVVFFHPSRIARRPGAMFVTASGESIPSPLAAELAPVGAANRRRFVHALATSDVQTIFDGGRMPLFGQESSVADLFDVLRHLPAQPFRTVTPRDPSRAQPLTVRTCVAADRTFVYVANDSPWRVNGVVNLVSADDCQFRPLGRAGISRHETDGNSHTWSLRLEPYDLAGAVLSAPNVAVQDFHVDIGEVAAEAMRLEISATRARLARVQAAQLVPLPVLDNPGFEHAGTPEQLRGWRHATGHGMSITLDPNGCREGRSSLLLQSRSDERWFGGPVVWVRSQPFARPPDGRLAARFWLRTVAPSAPAVRLSLEGQRASGDVYRQSVDMGPSTSAVVTDTWLPFWLRVADIPDDVNELRVGVDLRGAGDLWVDDVALFDVWFDDREITHFTNTLGQADECLRGNRLSDLRQLADDYWWQLLRRRVLLGIRPPPQAAEPIPVSTKPSKPATALWTRTASRPPPQPHPAAPTSRPAPPIAPATTPEPPQLPLVLPPGTTSGSPVPEAVAPVLLAPHAMPPPRVEIPPQPAYAQPAYQSVQMPVAGPPPRPEPPPEPAPRASGLKGFMSRPRSSGPSLFGPTTKRP